MTKRLLYQRCIMLASIFLATTAYAQPPLFLRCGIQPEGLNARSLSSSQHVFDFGSYACVDGPGDCVNPIQVRDLEHSNTSLAVANSADASEVIFLAARTMQTRSVSSCSFFNLNPTRKILRIGTAVWLETSSEVLVLDPLQSQIFSISPTGVVTSDTRGPAFASQSPDAFLPARLEKLENGYLLTTTDSRVAVIDPAYRARISSGNIQVNYDGTKTKIGSLTDLSVSGGNLVAYGSLRNESSTEAASPFSIGFIHARVQVKPWLIKDAKLLPVQADQKYYLMGHRYIATIESGMYFVAMREGAAKLFAYFPKRDLLKPLEALPTLYAKVPAIRTTINGPADAISLYREVEGSRMPVGLYGQGRFLYLLTREPSPRTGETEWRLHQIDPSLDRLVGTVKLPTSASHLTIVPAGDRWYVLEKSKAQHLGRQDLESMIMIPTKWISNPKGSPINEKNAELVQCDRVEQRKIRQGGTAN